MGFRQHRRGAAHREQRNAGEAQENRQEQIVLHRRAPLANRLAGRRRARTAGKGRLKTATAAKIAAAMAMTKGSKGIFRAILIAVPMARPAAAAVAPKSAARTSATPEKASKKLATAIRIARGASMSPPSATTEPAAPKWLSPIMT